MPAKNSPGKSGTRYRTGNANRSDESAHNAEIAEGQVTSQKRSPAITDCKLKRLRGLIVGVAPAGFFGFQPGENPELWWPLQMAPQVDGDPAGQRLNEGQQVLRLMGRLSAGVTRRQAEAELSDAFAHVHRAHQSLSFCVKEERAFLSKCTV